MSIKIFIYELEGQEPIISLTDKSTTRFKFTDEEIDFNNDGKINEQSGEKFRSITINGNILLGHILNKTEISKEAEEVKCLINWALLPGDDEKCYKRIEIREIDELNDMGGNDELIEEIEYAYVADYKEHYNLTAGKNSGLVPFEIIIKERVNIGDESLSNIIPTVDNSGSNEINDNKDLNQDNNLNFSDSTYRVSTLVENLKVGSKGEQVKQLQKRLNELCKENLVVDGDFGTNTKHAVDRFKQQYGLGNSGENAGVVGEQTWKYLFPKINNDLDSNYSDYNETVKIVKNRLKQTNYYSGSGDYESALTEFKKDNDISSEIGISVKTFEKLFNGTGTVWKELPINDKIEKFISVAKNEVGYKEGKNNYTKYGQWYGDLVSDSSYQSTYWCAMFVTWCAYNSDLLYYDNKQGVPYTGQKANLPDLLNGEVPVHAYTWYGVSFYRERGKLKERSSGYKPKRGDIIYFSGDGHVGIVTGYDKVTDKVYTIEGNSSDQVRENSYLCSNSTINSYGQNGGTTYGQITNSAIDGSNNSTY